MKSILNRFRQLSDGDLQVLSEALDTEINRRSAHDEAIPESARRRAIQRSQSYRHKTGASALPVMVAGMRERRKRHRAA